MKAYEITLKQRLELLDKPILLEAQNGNDPKKYREYYKEMMLLLTEEGTTCYS